MRDVPESELIDRVKNRDKAAFEELYNRHSPPVLGLAKRILREGAAAEDALQETFLTFWNKAALFNARRGALLSWLFAVCRNICLDRLKRPAEKREIPVSHFHNSSGWDYQGDKVSYAEIHAMITGALAKLSADQRRIIELAFFSGQSHAEIAAHTAMPLGTVKSIIAAALKKLRGEIRENWQFGGDWE